MPYLPVPPRAWNRVENLLYRPDPMLRKGNVLQVKKNQNPLTRAQKYAKIARGMWTNRVVTWAVQRQGGFTDPNALSLQRVGNVGRLAIDARTGGILGPTWRPPTACDQLDKVPVIVIRDGGRLLCNVKEELCSGKRTFFPDRTSCHPASASDVPGRPTDLLCWNESLPTWYDKQRTVMPTATDKWPVNARLESALRPDPPVITLIENRPSTQGENLASTLIEWVEPEASCVLARRFEIWLNGRFVYATPGAARSAQLPWPYHPAKDKYVMYAMNGRLRSFAGSVAPP